MEGTDVGDLGSRWDHQREKESRVSLQAPTQWQKGSIAPAGRQHACTLSFLSPGDVMSKQTQQACRVLAPEASALLECQLFTCIEVMSVRLSVLRQ